MSPTHQGQASDQSQPDARFSELERQFLLLQPRMGPQVVQRLEQAGFHSIQQLLEARATLVVLRVSDDRDFSTWANRRKALQRALLIWSAREQATLARDAAEEFEA